MGIYELFRTLFFSEKFRAFKNMVFIKYGSNDCVRKSCLSSEIEVSYIEQVMEIHDFPPNPLCNLHREILGFHHFETSISELRQYFYHGLF